jgi:Tol biopolymer transport system component
MAIGRITRIAFLASVAIFLFSLIASSGANPHAPDGPRAGGSPGSVVFYGARDGQPNKQIYVMNPDGSTEVRVTYDTAADVDPDISPNGQQTVFTSNNDIFVQDRSGVARNLTNSPARNEWARWSPDGTQIVFGSNRDGGVYEVFVINADGSGSPTELTKPPILGRYPSWSPDGKQIVFRRGIDIYTINADGERNASTTNRRGGAQFRADARLVAGREVRRVHELPRRVLLRVPDECRWN